ncbi:hypothetical protein ASD11_02620 [Aeromicrobium sp. Root495]|nr:hypothetical protein ASD11_02620 [Aeromicrobium sp. Root495]
MAETADASASELRRRTLISAAVTRWTKDLIDIGRRNALLYYRDLTAGTLDLAKASPGGMTSLLAGRSVKLAALFPSEIDRLDAAKRAKTIYKKVRELEEERGISAGYLTVGMATWIDETPAGGRPPMAPIVLRPITIKASSASHDEFVLQAADAAEVNPVLVHVLREQFGLHLDVDELTGMLELEGNFDVATVVSALGKTAAEIPGFATIDRTVVGTFTYAKLPMVNDLQAGLDLLDLNDVVAALAGDPDGQAALRESGSSDLDESTPDHTPPPNEFLVLDADSSQNYAINSVVSGQNLVIKGPPGTGKSQTISNLIATLVAEGQRVLFVAEKRAAIDAVLSRLERTDLNEWVMDLHDGAGNRRKVAQSLATTLDRAGRTPSARLADLHHSLVTSRTSLLDHNTSMHRPREPWGVSVFDLQTALIGIGHADFEARVAGAALQGSTEQTIAAAKRTIAEYADLGGLSANATESPWFGSPIAVPEQAQCALAAVQQLRTQTVPQVSLTLRDTVTDAGLREPVTLSEWREVFALLDAAADVCGSLDAAVYSEDLNTLVGASSTRKERRHAGVTLGLGARRAAIKRARKYWVGSRKPKRADLCAQLIAARDLASRWAAASGGEAPPRVPATHRDAEGAYGTLSDELRALGALLHSSASLEARTTAELLVRLQSLASDQDTLFRLPRRNELEGQLITAGFGPLLDECRRRGVRPDDAATILQSVWLRSVLESLRASDTTLGAFQGTTLHRIAKDFRSDDNLHTTSTPDRVRRACAENLVATMDRNPEQSTLIRAEANKKTRHKPMRKLLDDASDVLLALKPCWAMSPLVVSQILPLRQLFDVVIFDEASQIPPADAVPSIMRGKRVAVAGDERQLPPTSFFANTSASDESDSAGEASEDSIVAMTDGFESILDALIPIAPFRSLGWHYRSLDERLIAFSNAHIYDSSLTTFPGAHGDEVLRYVHVPRGGALGDGTSSAEVEKVVDLVIEHAQTRATESLGVITMGITHADRIDVALRRRLPKYPELEEFFDESRVERFFIKNLERVQGDERDAIILSIGYGKAADGRMAYRFGPLNNEGGERRLNVAVSRAKRRATLVSSFTAADLDPSRLNKRGAQLLRSYVEFMASGGTHLGSEKVPPQLNPFEIDVRDRLNGVGVPLVAQHGVGSYRIDFAVPHPTIPGRYVLAIEADGASYHSSHTARDRDRLRQEHLERLGWQFHRIWSTDWFRTPDAEVQRAFDAYMEAISESEHVRQPEGEATVLTPMVMPSVAASRQLPRPHIRFGLPIVEYSEAELVDVIRWVTSDGLLRTEDQLLSEVMDELGFSRRGGRIVATIAAAIVVAKS